ncbi:MAG: DUF2726 domain-containing protein [Phycisphaerales bacterium]|nr:DUF2726 domain-containing protein [Phycisphaerales bacterium]
MQYAVGLVILVLLLSAAAFLLKQMGVRKAGLRAAQALPYRRRDYLLSKAEHSFYRVLQRAVGERWTVFAKVRLLDLLWIPPDTPNAQSHRNRVQSKHVDFVLCSLDTVRPVLIIELDDSSHKSESRGARDTFVNEAVHAAGIPILHVTAQRSYALPELVSRIASLTSESTAPDRPAASPAAGDRTDVTIRPKQPRVN